MTFDLDQRQQAWQTSARTLTLPDAAPAPAEQVVRRAADAGLTDPGADLLAVLVAAEALAGRSAAAGAAYALHAAAVRGAVSAPAGLLDALVRGERVAALALSGDEVPGIQDGRVSGAASWVAPVTARGVAILGARRDAEVDALLVGLDEAGVAVHPEATAGWPGVTFARVTLAAVQATPLGSASPVMALVRILMAAVALGIGRRALEEALVAARATGGADAGEQTVQGLLADAATDLDAARLVTWKAGQGRDVPSLASASSAKLAATAAAQGAVVRATQVVGALSFVRGHVLEQLSQDVRAIELFAGRTEALRSAAAADVLPDIG